VRRHLPHAVERPRGVRLVEQAHERQVASERQVPGAFAPVKNAFHVSQALSWLASHRGTLEDQFERTVEIDGLMSSLLAGGQNRGKDVRDE
jgi:hypothetical protein